MNGRQINLVGLWKSAWCWLNLFVALLVGPVGAQSAGRPGDHGQANAQGTVNFAEAAAAENRHGPPPPSVRVAQPRGNAGVRRQIPEPPPLAPANVSQDAVDA